MAFRTNRRLAAHLSRTSREVAYRWRISPTYAVEYISPTIEGLIGRPPAAFYANPLAAFDYVVDEDRSILQSLMTDPAERKDPVLLRMRHADGSVVWVEIVHSPVRDRAGRIVTIDGVMRDVTQQKRMERERDAHVALLAALIENLQDGVMAEDDAARIIVMNAAYCRMFGLAAPAQHFIGRSATELREHIWSELTGDAASYRRLVDDLRRHRAPQLGYEISLMDGRVLNRDYVPVPGPDGSVVHMWHYREVTERRHMESRLRESRRRLRELSAHAETLREQERRNLARTLHDELGQIFSTIRLELGAAILRFKEGSVPAMRPIVDRLQAAVGLTDVAVVSLRHLTTELRPPILDHLGLVPAIRWEASLFTERTGIRTRVRAKPAAPELPAPHVTALYRILREALSNVAKHSGAGTTWIYLTKQPRVTLLEIRDNGRGITEGEINNPRTMGLLGMRERALTLGGEVRITRARGRGTRVLVILPDPDCSKEADA